MDQGDLPQDAGALAPAGTWLTPARALILTLGAVLGGVALSLLIGSSAAHAAEGDGSGPGTPPPGPIVTATSSLSGSLATSVTHAGAALSATVAASIPLVQHSVGAAGEAVSTHAPVTAPVVAPVVASVDATLSAVQQVVTSTVSTASALPTLLPIADLANVARQGAAPAQHGQASSGPPTGSAIGGVLAAQNGAGSDGALPGPVLTSAAASPAATLALVLGVVALVLLGARRRWHDEAPPASPAFELDTSPA